MLKIGLIGAGWHAAADHAPALRHCLDADEFRGCVELSGVHDIDRARATEVAERFGFRRAYDSIDAMLPEVDALLSIVPAAALAATLEPILRARRPVLIEKPLGRDLDEARRIAATLDGYPHMVSLNRRFDPAVRIARQWMAKQSPPRRALGTMWRRNRVEPDFVWGTGIHLTDLLCFLLGPLKLTRGVRKGAGREGLFESGNGVDGQIHIWPCHDRVDEAVEIFGDDWYAMIQTGKCQPWEVTCCAADVIEIDATADPNSPDFIRNGAAEETAVFLRGALRGEMIGPTVADAMPGTELAAALQAADGSPAYDGNSQ